MAQFPVQFFQDRTPTELQIQVAKSVPAVSLVLPVFNEGSKVVSIIDSAIRKFESLFNSNFELIIVDDGSTDATRTLLDRMNKNDRVKVVGYLRNAGKGNALMFGFQFASAEKVIFADGDMQAIPRKYEHYLEALNSSDIVVSSKRVPGARVNAGAKRRLLSVGFNVLVKLLLPIRVTDTQAGFKAFRREALGKILPLISVKRYAFDVELLAIASLLKFRISEFPISVTLKSSFRGEHILRMIIDILGIAYRLRLKHWYQENILKEIVAPYKPVLDLD